ncbi:PEX25 [Candida theae]|uniref:PEX25 n=1 Tax=Candida theae TaxID=1198502 RepID=A0AAD5BHR6_9ASCO|nr:PEX25 [Candida theae]KAI5964441.1 PEX25 [Candida theae]
MNEIDSSISPLLNQAPIEHSHYYKQQSSVYDRRPSHIDHQGSDFEQGIHHTQPQNTARVNTQSEESPQLQHPQQASHPQHPQQESHPQSLDNQHHHLHSISQVNKHRSRQSPLYPSSKLYSQPPPQAFNSEWIESAQNSPENISKILEDQVKMSTTTAMATGSNIRYETPSKSKNDFAYNSIPLHHDDTQKIDKAESLSQASSTASTIPPKPPKISNWKIFWAMLNNIVGKDKMAKVGQYTLRLLVFHATQAQDYLSDDKVNIATIKLRYDDSTKQLELLKNFIKHPADFIKIIAIIVCSTFTTRFAGMINGLSMYRQFLRFGKTPFRIRDLLVKFKTNINFKNKMLQINERELFNRSTLSQIFSLYYGVNDESILLYKLKFLTSGTYKTFVTKHESYAWYCESWLALYNAYETLTNLTQQEMDLKIAIQVRNKAKILSKQLLGGADILNLTSSTYNSSSNSEDESKLKDIMFKKTNCWIDIYKLLADLGFNTYSVFSIALPFQTWQIWMGIAASTLSTIKLYRETKDTMVKEHEK